MLTRPKSCAGPAHRQAAAQSLACGTRGWPSSQLPGEKETCLPQLGSLLMPPLRLFLWGRVNAAAVACVRSLPEPKYTNEGQGRPVSNRCPVRGHAWS